MDVLKRILQSNYTVIGYDSNNENKVRKLINLIPNRTEFGLDEPIYSEELDEFFNSKSHFRDFKLNSILNNELNQYIIIDVSSVYFYNDIDSIGKLQYFRSLQSLVYSLNDSDSNLNYHLILLSKIFYAGGIQPLIKGGQGLIYTSEVALYLIDDDLKIIKDRYNEPTSMNLTQELRQISLKKILNENN